MKDLKKYIEEKLIVFHPQVDEKLVVNKNYKITKYKYYPESWEELRQIIEDRFEEQGPGTVQEPIDFNDIDVSEMTTFYNTSTSQGIFEEMEYEYIDISDWNVSKVENMRGIFWECTKLKSIGDISNWDVSNVEDISSMFHSCHELEYIGDISNWNTSNFINTYEMFMGCYKLKSLDLSNWNVSNVENVAWMFGLCKKLESIGDLSKWNVSKTWNMTGIFNGCKKLKSVGDLNKWDVSNVEYMIRMFANSAITNIPNWYKK